MFGRTGAKRRTPFVAIIAQTTVSVLVTLIMGGVWDPTSAFGFVGFTNALAGAVAFMMILAAAMVFFHKVEPEKGWVRNLLLPAVGIAIRLPAVYTAFYPNPGPTAKWAPWVIVAWTVLGGVYLAARAIKRQSIDLDYAFRDLGEEPAAASIVIAR